MVIPCVAIQILTDHPPGGVGGELEAHFPVELLDGADETEVALLDEIEEIDAQGVGVSPCVRHNKPEVGGQERILCLTAVTDLATKSDLLGPVWGRPTQRAINPRNNRQGVWVGALTVVMAVTLGWNLRLVGSRGFGQEPADTSTQRR